MGFHAGKAERGWEVSRPACSSHRAPHCLLGKSCPFQYPHWDWPAASLLADVVAVPKTAAGSDGQLSGEAELGVSFGSIAALNRALKDGVGNLLIINFLTRFLATFTSCPSWKCYENIFSRGILSLPISDSKWENIYSNIREIKKKWSSKLNPGTKGKLRGFCSI